MMRRWSTGKFRDAPPLADRFHALVDRRSADECWPWKGGDDGKGYGRIFANGRTHHAHQLALVLAGSVRPVGAWALHSCDNPSCCNPAHLRWGDARENVKDRVERGRCGRLTGERQNGAKLNASIVQSIRRDLRSQREIAAEHGVTQTLISQIKCRRIWAHVE